MEAPPGFEPGVEVLQTSALPLGDGAPEKHARLKGPRYESREFVTCRQSKVVPPTLARLECQRAEVGAGNGIRTRDFDLGKVALYH
jgi:hypothetical protein